MDKFNKIWKNRFNQGDLPDADWNIPDAEVWTAISAHVPVKRNRPLLFLWISLGLSLLLIALLSYFYFEQNFISDRSAPDTEPSVLALAKNDLPTKFTVSEEKNVLASSVSQVDKRVSTTAVFPGSKNPRIEKNISLHSSMDIALQRRTESRGISRSRLAEGKPIMGDSKAGQDLTEEHINFHSESALLSPLHFLPTVDPFVQMKADKVLDTVKKPVQVDLPKVSKFKVALQTGATYWQHRISEEYTNDLSAFDFNYSDDWGWNVDLVLAFAISDKFAMTGGLGYERVQTHSGHNSNLNYDPGLEQGQAINDYDATLATPYGTSGASFRFSRVEELGEEFGRLTSRLSLNAYGSKYFCSARHYLLPAGADEDLET